MPLGASKKNFALLCNIFYGFWVMEMRQRYLYTSSLEAFIEPLELISLS